MASQIEQVYKPTDTAKNHPALSSVPSVPGPELDSKHYQHEPLLPEPPLFSPPISNTTFDDTNLDLDLSIGVNQSHSSSTEDVTDDQSHHDISTSVNEPRTPESIAPSLDYVPFITHDSLSVDHLDHPPEIIAKAHIPQPDEEHDHSEKTSHHVNDQSATSTSEEPLSFKAADSHQEQPIESQENQPESLIASKVEEPASQQLPPRPKEVKQTTKNAVTATKSSTSMSVDDWLDISRTEFQFAIGLFAIPWSSLVLFTRSINMFWSLVFTQPLVQPISGVLPSIVAPSLLYASLVALLISSAAEINW